MVSKTVSEYVHMKDPEIFTEYGESEEGTIIGYTVRQRHKVQWETYDPKEWEIEVRFTQRLPPLPTGARADVAGEVWRRNDTGNWHPLAGLGFTLCPMTDKQVRAVGKPLVVCGEWPIAYQGELPGE